MHRRIAWFAALFLSAPLLLAQAPTSNMERRPEADRVATPPVVVDAHVDVPTAMMAGFDPAAAGDAPWTLDKARQGGLGAEFFSIWVDPKKCGDYVRCALDEIDAVREFVRLHADKTALATSVDEVYKARAAGRLAILLGMEGAHPLKNDVRLLRIYHALGVRYLGLTWANSNEWATSAGGMTGYPTPAWADDEGLSMEGRQLFIREMNRLGMMIDVSHASDRSFFNALTASRAPILASHSNARALTPSPRNLSDQQLAALAEKGGVAQVNFACGYLDADYKDGAPRPPLSKLIDHIEHIAKLVGVEHVGVGSDWPYIGCAPAGLDSVADLPKIAEALKARGYSQADVDKIMGGNLLRLMSDVEAVSRQMQAEENSDRREVIRLPLRKKAAQP